MEFKTYVNPTSTYVPPITKAFDLFVQELCIDTSKIEPGSSLKINTSGKHDQIKIDENHIFSKKKFIANKKFRNKLEEYYNQHNIYIEKPFFIDEMCFLRLKVLYSKNTPDKISSNYI